MFIAGRGSWKISIDEPQVLQIALYIREVAGLETVTDPPIPPLDPSAAVWPAWARKPPESAAPELSGIDGVAASTQWSRWWNHALDVGAPALRDLAHPSFKAFGHLPELRELLISHYPNALSWSTASGDDPRIKRDHLASGRRLTGLMQSLERDAGRHTRPFQLRITVIAVQSKHAWILDQEHLLVTHHLMRDDENLLDWLRSQIIALV
jgi:hypothetical protein